MRRGSSCPGRWVIHWSALPATLQLTLELLEKPSPALASLFLVSHPSLA